jgi:hypothetical protein
MIPKSGYRFSEKIMLKQQAKAKYRINLKSFCFSAIAHSSRPMSDSLDSGRFTPPEREHYRATVGFCLRFVHHGREPVQVADINGQPHAILQARPLGLRNQPDVEQCLTNAGLRILHQPVGRRITALHSGYKDEVAGARPQTPGTLCLYRAGRIKSFDTFGDAACARAKLNAITVAVTPARANRCNIASSFIR